jgi:Ca-activated chloride channel family protein
LKDVLGPKDRAFLVYFGNHIRLVSDYSQSSTELIHRFEEYTKSIPKETFTIFGGHGAKNNKKSDEPKIPELGPDENRVEGTAYFDSIYFSVTEKLGQEIGRRALIVFSDGEDNSSEYDMMSAIESAQSADVLIFTIRYTEDKKGQLTPRNKFGIRVMARVAKETGGADFDARKMNPRDYFKQIAEELRSMYEVGYYSTNSAQDQTFRKVVVTPTGEGIKIRSKPGYYAR